MPRPKPKKGSPAVHTDRHVLSDEVKRELLNLLGVDCPLHLIPKKAAKALSDVELRLEAYPSAVEARDSLPRSANYRETLTPIRQRAFGLLNDLCDLHQWMHDALTVQGVNVGDLMHELGALVDAAGVVVREHSGKESRGQPRNLALRAVVGELRAIFARCYVGDPSRPSRARGRGASVPLSEQENDEVEFIRIALDDAGISCPVNIRRYFATPPERTEGAEKIVRKERPAEDATKSNPA